MEDRPLALSCVALAIAAGVSLLMAQAAGFHRVRMVISHGMSAWLALILGARVASYAGYAAAHRATVARGTGVRRQESLKMVAFGAAATSLGGGFSVDRRALRGAGASARDATVKVLNLGALEFATLAPAACVCAFALLGTRHVDSQMTVPWAVGVPVGFTLALAAASRASPRSLSRKGRLGRAASRVLEALELLGEQLRHPLANAGAWLGMALYWAGEIVSLWAALRAFGVHAQLPQTILAYATGHVLTPRSVPLSGVGVTEVLLPLALVWVGVALANAVVAVFAYRIVLLSLSIPPALLARERIRQLVRGRTRAR